MTVAEADEGGSIYTELMAAATSGGQTFKGRTPRETEQQFLERLTRHVLDLEKETWDALSPEAQEWHNNAVDAINDDKPLTAPEGMEEVQAVRPARKGKAAAAEAEADADPEAEGEAATAEKEKPRRGRKAAADKPAKEPRETKERKTRQPKEGFTMREMRRMIISNPDVGVKDLIAKAEQEGVQFSRSSIVLAHQTTKTMINLVKETGHWRD